MLIVIRIQVEEKEGLYDEWQDDLHDDVQTSIVNSFGYTADSITITVED